MSAAMSTTQTTPPTEAWFSFVGVLDLQIARTFISHFTDAIGAQIKRVHLLIQSPGGNANEGIFLFEYLQSLPIEVLAYNCGHVGSAAVTAYLGAHKRIVSPHATFMVHKATTPHGAIYNAPTAQAVVDNLKVENGRIEAILKERVKLTRKQVRIFNSPADVILTAQEAIETGMAHEIGHFKPTIPLRNI